MPFISLVVPVYQVEAYLEACLDSILGQPFNDIELIAVDDAARDRSGEIIDDYAARDPRVKPIHLTRNVGLGEARNTGFDAATGEYVWFIDSDDWLADGALAQVAQRLQATTTSTRPDVLVVDYARAYAGTRRERNINAPILRHAPETFRIADYPELLANFVAAWNKVVRADFLRETGLRFPTGWYEDIPFTYPLLARAGRISVLPTVCVYYRQRRHGSILGTTSARHTQVLDQYELALARIDDPLVREHVARAAIDHGSTILGIPERLPSNARKDFFKRLRAFGWRYGGFRPGIRDYLLSRGAWRAYWTLKRLRRLDFEPPPLWTVRLFPRLAYYWLQRRFPLRDLAVYGSYWGRAYECNPAAIHAAAQRLAPHVRGVWAVRKDQLRRLPEGVDGVVIRSFAYYRALARAKWTFNNANFGDEIVKRPGSVHVQTHHGTPLKLMGVDEPAFRDDPEALLKRCDRWDFSLSSNRYSTEVWARAYPCRFESLEYGYPRNDILVNATPELVSRLRARHPDGPLVLYAPTFREAQPVPPKIKGFTVITKPHYSQGDDGDGFSIEELMLVSDVLVTDYSSVMFDFALLDRPIAIYAPDWEHYRAGRGVYFDLLAQPPGIVARTERELNDAFESGAVWDTSDLRAAFRERFCQFDDGRAAERVVRRVILSETGIPEHDWQRP